MLRGNCTRNFIDLEQTWLPEYGFPWAWFGHFEPSLRARAPALRGLKFGGDLSWGGVNYDPKYGPLLSIRNPSKSFPPSSLCKRPLMWFMHECLCNPHKRSEWGYRHECINHIKDSHPWINYILWQASHYNWKLSSGRKTWKAIYLPFTSRRNVVAET